MRAHLHLPARLEPDFRAAGFERGAPGDGLVFAALDEIDGWEGCLAVLTEAFRLTRAAAGAAAPALYVVHGADLLGQRGTARAMAACGLLSGARTAAIEGRKTTTPVNVLSVADDTPPGRIARWAQRLLLPDSPTGVLVRLDPGHLGKALP